MVALETAIVSHGLPRPTNLVVAREVEAAVRAAGAVPATIAVLGGRPTIGLSDQQLEHMATAPGMIKLSDRDLPLAMAQGVDGATTVAATVTLAALAGIFVMATGGMGGVHRGARESWDISADLMALRREPVTVVAAGVKSVLDVAATLEQMETLGVPVVGYRTRNFPGFLISDSGHRLDWSVDDPQAVAEMIAAMRVLDPQHGGLLLANPVAVDLQLDPAWHGRILAGALAQSDKDEIRGKAVTPFLLSYMERETQGRSVQVNREVVLGNARLAAQVARAVAAARSLGGGGSAD